MIETLFFAFWFFTPAGIANVTPLLVAHIPALKPFSYPVDFYRKIGGQRILGSHKTIRGFIFGCVCAMCIAWLQIIITSHTYWLSSVMGKEYNHSNPLLLGFLLGFGALCGDSVKSFFKRRVRVKPGNSWFPFDQLDYIIGGLVFVSLYIHLSFHHIVTIVILWFILHIASSMLGYILKYKKTPI